MTPLSAESGKTLVVDANVIIDLAKADRLDLLGSLEGWEVVVPDQVVEEVTYPDQAAALERALAAGHLTREASTELTEIALYAGFRPRMGRGEAACLAMAASRGWIVVSGDRGRAFRRQVRETIGESRLMDMADLLRLASEAGRGPRGG